MRIYAHLPLLFVCEELVISTIAKRYMQNKQENKIILGEIKYCVYEYEYAIIIILKFTLIFLRNILS